MIGKIQKKRTIFSVLLMVEVFLLFCPVVMGQEAEEIPWETINAEQLTEELTEGQQEVLEHLGISSLSPADLLQISPKSTFTVLFSMIKEGLQSPLKIGSAVLAVFLLCSLLNTVNGSFGQSEYQKILQTVCLLMTELTVIVPLCTFLKQMIYSVEELFRFMTLLIPTMTGILIAQGQVIFAGKYSILVVSAAEFASVLSTQYFLPITNLLLVLSLTANTVGRPGLQGIVSLVQKAVKWCLGFCMSIFMALLSLQSAVSAASDTVSVKALKFIIGSTVPIVGSAVNEALNTVRGSLSLLKTTAGVFGILAGLAILLPMIIQLLLWRLTVHFCSCAGEVLELKEIKSVFDGLNEVLGLLFALLLCCCIMLVISVGILLSQG